MKDLIRDYKMLLKRRESVDSDGESQPLLSSSGSSTSFGATQDECMFRDSDTTDYESEKTKSVQPVNGTTPKTFMRRPFCNVGASNFDTPTLDIFTYDENVYDRFTYFSKMNGVLNVSQNALIRKGVSFQDVESAEKFKTQGSIVTIFTVWNTTMGSSLLAMAWGIQQSGLLAGLLLNVVVGGLCLYTTYTILKVNENHGLVGQNNEVSDLCRLLIGRWAEILAKIFSLVVLIGANIVYWVLMSSFLYHSVDFFYAYVMQADFPVGGRSVLCPKEAPNATVDNFSVPKSTYHEVWDLYSTVPIILGVCMFPLLNFKSPTFFTKFNSLGTLSVLYLLIFVAVKSYDWGFNISNWEFELDLKTNFCALTGMLSLSYFIHNIIISIMRSNRHQENNGRDLSVAFGLILFTYLFIGGLFYTTFPLAKSCIEDNLLNNFPKNDTLTIVARFLLLFQLVTVFPLMMFMLRNDIFANICSLFSSNGGEFSYLKVVVLNIVVITVCVLFACFLPHIGTLIRYTGALSGLVYIFLLPSLLKVASLRKEGRLTYPKLALFSLIIVLGFVNLFTQFFITAT